MNQRTILNYDKLFWLIFVYYFFPKNGYFLEKSYHLLVCFLFECRKICNGMLVFISKFNSLGCESITKTERIATLEKAFVWMVKLNLRLLRRFISWKGRASIDYLTRIWYELIKLHVDLNVSQHVCIHFESEKLLYSYFYIRTNIILSIYTLLTLLYI